VQGVEWIEQVQSLGLYSKIETIDDNVWFKRQLEVQDGRKDDSTSASSIG